MSDYSSFFLWPDEQRIIPPNNATIDGWVIANPLTANNTSFRSQWIQCQYPISGGYGLTPRIVFYVLAAVSIYGRGHEWATSAALGAVMIYSSTAAIHALILVGIREQLSPSSLFQMYQIILVQGQSPDGWYYPEDTTQHNAALWLPVAPMAWDQDCDPTLLITGVAFLLLLPMYNFSKTLKKASIEQQLIIAFWALLLFAGLVAALINVAYVFFWTFPQLRFCPLDQADDIPFQNSGARPVVGPRELYDEFLWNRTVRDYFVFNDTTIRPTTACLYPCFDTSWPLRDPTDIQVHPGHVGVQFETASMLWFQIAVYALVGCSAVGGITLAMIKHLPWLPADWRIFDLKISWKSLVKGYSKFLSGFRGKFNLRRSASRLGKLILRLWIFLVVLYSSVLSPFALIVFIVFYEWFIAVSDPGAETFRHVGQWNVLVGAVLALGAATIPGIILRAIRKKKGSGLPP